MPSRAVFRTAAVDDYVEWLTRWLAAGNQPTHYYEYPFNNRSWLVALKDFTTGGECGSAAVQIVAPPGIRHAGGDLGHNNLYFQEGPDQRGDWVPIYSDPAFAGLGLAKFIDAEQEKYRRLTAERESRRRQRDAVPSDVKRHFSPENTDPEQLGMRAVGDDDALLKALGGATFGPETKVTLPSGQTIDGAEAQVWASFHAPAVAEDRPRRRWWE